MLDRRVVLIAELRPENVPCLRGLIRKYRDQRMDLADATLVRIAERDGLRQVLTLDRRDFEVYRLGRRETFTLVALN